MIIIITTKINTLFGNEGCQVTEFKDFESTSSCRINFLQKFYFDNENTAYWEIFHRQASNFENGSGLGFSTGPVRTGPEEPVRGPVPVRSDMFGPEKFLEISCRVQVSRPVRTGPQFGPAFLRFSIGRIGRTGPCPENFFANVL